MLRVGDLFPVRMMIIVGALIAQSGNIRGVAGQTTPGNEVSAEDEEGTADGES